MAKFKIKSSKRNNSHPIIKLELRKKIIDGIKNIKVLDIYGGYGLIYKKLWEKTSEQYIAAEGDSIEWLKSQKIFNQNVFDIDPYASPFEAIEIICKKAKRKKIIIICTDGYLRRIALMRLKLNEYIQKKCNWPERDLSLLAAIYHQYPKFLRYILSKICLDWKIEKLYIKYGSGTWRQATVYFAVVLKKS